MYLSRKTKRALIITLIILVVLAIFAIFPGGVKAIRKNFAGVSSNQRKICVIISTDEINKGEIISQKKLIAANFPENLVPANAVENCESIVGNTPIIEIKKNTIITKSMIAAEFNSGKVDQRLCDYEFQGGMLDLVKTGDLIDIEYVREDGSTYVVLSKKKVFNKIEDKIVIQTSLKERKMINHVLTEKNAEGGNIEIVIYIDDNQKASKVTYQIPKTAAVRQTENTSDKLAEVEIESGDAPPDESAEKFNETSSKVNEASEKFKETGGLRE